MSATSHPMNRGEMVTDSPDHLCEQCDRQLVAGDKVAFAPSKTPGRSRYWHQECFDKSVVPFADWPKSDRKTIGARTMPADYYECDAPLAGAKCEQCDPRYDVDAVWLALCAHSKSSPSVGNIVLSFAEVEKAIAALNAGAVFE